MKLVAKADVLTKVFFFLICGDGWFGEEMWWYQAYCWGTALWWLQGNTWLKFPDDFRNLVAKADVLTEVFFFPICGDGCFGAEMWYQAYCWVLNSGGCKETLG